MFSRWTDWVRALQAEDKARPEKYDRISKVPSIYAT